MVNHEGSGPAAVSEDDGRTRTDQGPEHGRQNGESVMAAWRPENRSLGDSGHGRYTRNQSNCEVAPAPPCEIRPMRRSASAGRVQTPPRSQVRPSLLVSACSRRSPDFATVCRIRSQVVVAGGPTMVPP